MGANGSGLKYFQFGHFEVIASTDYPIVVGNLTAITGQADRS